MSKKVWTSQHHSLDRKMLEKAFDLVADPQEADFCICWKVLPPKPVDLDKIVLCQSEPLVAGGRLQLYSHYPSFHTVLCFDPDPHAPNQFPFSLTHPHLFPYRPWIKMQMALSSSEYNKLSGVYFAGKKPGPAMKDRNNPGCKVIYQLRSRIAASLRSKLGGNCVGYGWPTVTRDDRNSWHVNKFKDLYEFKPKYVIAIENSRMKGYISEKIWDGLLSDRVTLYLGAPNVEDYIPPTAFVHLAKFLDDEYNFDVESCTAYLQELNETKTRRIASIVLKDAAKVMDGVRQDATKLVIDRING